MKLLFGKVRDNIFGPHKRYVQSADHQLCRSLSYIQSIMNHRSALAKVYRDCLLVQVLTISKFGVLARRWPGWFLAALGLESLGSLRTPLTGDTAEVLGCECLA